MTTSDYDDEADYEARKALLKVRTKVREILNTNGLDPVLLRRMTLSELRDQHGRLRNFPEGFIDTHRIDHPQLSSDEWRRVNRSLMGHVRSYRVYILRRIDELSQQEQVDELRDAVESKVQDPELRKQLAELIANFAEEQRNQAIEARSTEAAERMQEALHEAEMKERNWRRWKLMLDREPVAVLVGAVLLGVLTIALIAAMFSHTDVPEILASGFLLILGFFFGQAAGNGRPD